MRVSETKEDELQINIPVDQGLAAVWKTGMFF